MYVIGRHLQEGTKLEKNRGDKTSIPEMEAFLNDVRKSHHISQHSAFYTFRPT